MYPDTIEAVCECIETLVEEKILQKIPVYTMVTNMTVLTEKLLNLIKNYQIRLTVSIDGPEQINDKLRVYPDGSGTFKVVKNNLKQLAKNNIYPVMAEVTYTSLHSKEGYTYEQLKTYIKNEFNISNIFVGDCFGDTELAITKKELQDEKSETNYSYEYNILRALSNKKQLSSWKCLAGAEMLCLLADGKIYPCHLFLPLEEYCIGEFADNDWNFDKYNRAQKKLDKFSKKRCSCWARNFCESCPKLELLLSGKKHNCNSILEHTNRVLLKLAEKMETGEWDAYLKKVEEIK